MAKFHFVEDYEAHVKKLLQMYPLDEAMSLAVGGKYEQIGNVEKDIVIYAGLKDGMQLIDYGCGSGRLASALSQALTIQYTGVDIVSELLDYAQSKTPPNYIFIKHQKLTVPAESNSVDMICAFSLFTHLLQSEVYIYLEEMYRVLKKDGKVVFSFLEFHLPSHWVVFESAVKKQKSSTQPTLNMFMERNVINTWAKHLGFKIIEFIDGNNPMFNNKALGQSIAILKK